MSLYQCIKYPTAPLETCDLCVRYVHRDKQAKLTCERATRMTQDSSGKPPSFCCARRFWLDSAGSKHWRSRQTLRQDDHIIHTSNHGLSRSARAAPAARRALHPQHLSAHPRPYFLSKAILQCLRPGADTLCATSRLGALSRALLEVALQLCRASDEGEILAGCHS